MDELYKIKGLTTFSKLLDLLGYGSMIASSNTAKAAITKDYLGLDNVGDADNPLVYDASQTVNMLPILAYQKIYFDFFSNSQWEKHLAYAYNVDYWQALVMFLYTPICLRCVMPITLRTILWVCCLLLSMVR